jgi:hypothetical protein
MAGRFLILLSKSLCSGDCTRPLLSQAVTTAFLATRHSPLTIRHIGGGPCYQSPSHPRSFANSRKRCWLHSILTETFEHHASSPNDDS